MNFGERLKQLRVEKGLTQPQLAEAIGIEQSYLSKLENDKSVPSADIFQAMLKALAMDAGSFLESIDPSITHRQLRQIPEVANYLNAGTLHKIHHIKKWLYGSALACIAGVTLVIAGHRGLIFPDDQFYYFSEGIVLQGESKDIFGNWGLQFDNFSASPDNPRNIKTKEMFARKNEEFLVIHDYRGDKFNIAVPGGSRTYNLMNSIQSIRNENRALMLLGTLLACCGIFGFAVEFRLRKIY